jgi:hypothetical protein
MNRPIFLILLGGRFQNIHLLVIFVVPSYPEKPLQKERLWLRKRGSEEWAIQRRKEGMGWIARRGLNISNWTEWLMPKHRDLLKGWAIESTLMGTGTRTNST